MNEAYPTWKLTAAAHATTEQITRYQIAMTQEQAAKMMARQLRSLADEVEKGLLVEIKALQWDGATDIFADLVKKEGDQAIRIVTNVGGL